MESITRPMKKLFWIPALFIALFSCKDDDQAEVQPTPTVVNHANITVDERYLDNGEDVNAISGKFFVSDQSGEILISQEVANGGEYAFTSEVGAEEQVGKYDLTATLVLDRPSFKTALITTFLDVPASSDIHFNRMIPNTLPVSDHYYLTVTSERPLQPYSIAGSNFTVESQSDNEMSIRFSSSSAIESLYVVLMAENGDARYYFKEDITPNQSDTISFETLPEAPFQFNFEFPDLDGFGSKVWAKRTASDQQRYRVFESGIHAQNEDHELFMPTGLFELYEMTTNYRLDDKKYTIYEKRENLSSTFETSSLEGTYSGSTPLDFLLQSEDDEAYYKARFMLLLEADSLGKFQFHEWQIHGKADQIMELSLPDLLDEIGLEAIEISDFELSNVTMVKLSGNPDYADYINLQTDVNMAPFDVADLVEEVMW